MSNNSSIVKDRLKRRYLHEQLFKACGLFAVLLACIFLFIFIGSIMINGYTAFISKEIELKLKLDRASIIANNYQNIIEQSTRQMFPTLNHQELKEALLLISDGSEYELRKYVKKNIILPIERSVLAEKGKHISNMPSQNENSLQLDNLLDQEFYKEITYNLPLSQHGLACLEKKLLKCTTVQTSILNKLSKQGLIHTVFNKRFFLNSDSRNPEMAGMAGSIVGSIMTILICMGIAFPLAIGSAVYLEELAPKNKITYLIEISINNLAAVPSIVFGILGLAIFLGTLDIPRSSTLVGGLTLSMMALPMMVVVTRQAIKTVPHSIKQGAMALGASELQILLHHTLPLAIPGIMTGTILTVCRVIGETAPMIMIGMVAFIVDMPAGITDPATVMPVQIYLWADNPETAFKSKTAGAILVLLAILIFMNILSIFLRKKYDVKW